mmetsp:Transcript_10423/g.20484  ORF Transcript_10423/g.20484 Transcript_10423/m.20484 type:complete len:202 (-) Transcript_10423:140-745(-)
MAAAEIEGKVVVPGDKLGQADELTCGCGCYATELHVFASVVGHVHVEAAGRGEGGGEGAQKAVVNVVRRKDRFAPVVPSTGSLVIAKVQSINARAAKVSILSVNDERVKQAFPAMIRSQDVREHNKDDVQIASSFRPGDLVRASVVSLGDTRSYFLSTAEDGLGVVHATYDGVPMVAISAEAMQCPNTLVTQARKVAIKQD